MALSVKGKVLLDTNVFIDYLRSRRHADGVAGRVVDTVRFLSSVVLMELRLGADTPRRRRAVDGIKAAFPTGRIVAPGPELYDHAGRVFRAIHGDGGSLRDRLAAMDDLLIALTARQIGAWVVTSNIQDFARIALHLPGLAWTSPD